MFFNSFDNKMKKLYASLNPLAKKTIFPNGEAEFLFITTTMNAIFRNRKITELLPIYASLYSYSMLEIGNNYGIKKYATKKMPSYSEEEIYSMMTLVFLAQTPKKDHNTNLLEQFKTLEKGIKQELNVQLQIKAHPDIFNTKNNKEVGKFDNPILVSGRSGAEKYISNLQTDLGDDVEAERTECVYLTDSATNINYAIDKYILKNKSTNEEIGVLYFNEYGIEVCKLCPNGFKFKDKKVENGTEDDIKEATWEFNKINNGEQGKLSIAQITDFIISLQDAKSKLSPNEFNQIYNLYKKLKNCTTKLELDKEGYYETAIDIIKKFDKIAPYEKYGGVNETELSFLMDAIRKDENSLDVKKQVDYIVTQKEIECAKIIAKKSNGIITRDDAKEFIKVIREYSMNGKDSALKELKKISQYLIEKNGAIKALTQISFLLGVMNAYEIISKSEMEQLSKEYQEYIMNLLLKK